MNELARSSSSVLLPVAPRVLIATRLATMDDLPFLDALQKQHSKALGFFPRAQMEGYVKSGWVLIAEDAATKQPLGYCASRDRYLKRDELGVIYQLCVAPGHQRGLIGASLIKAVFDRSAYGCRLYCCWCAQDLDANYFWESLGFLPIAFRAGSTGKKRVHIFWQRRIVEGDTTPWWYPSQTNGGAIRADRLVFPIPPGTYWRDIRPPDIRPPGICPAEEPAARPALPGAARPRRAPVAVAAKPAGVRMMGGLYAAPAPPPPTAKNQRTPRAKAATAKIDPKLITATRELRDRYLERVNTDGPYALTAILGKYDVTRDVRRTPEAARLPRHISVSTETLSLPALAAQPAASPRTGAKAAA